MKASLDGHFTVGRLLKNAISPIIMMIVLSIYTIVDGIFISNFTNETAFAAVNLIFPPIMAVTAIGFMLGSGGCALVAKRLGEKKDLEASQIFTFLIIFVASIGVILGIALFFAIRPIGSLLGAKDEMLDYCVTYAQPLAIALPFFMLQNLFQSFFPVAERPTMGLVITIGAGVMNMGLDALLVAGFKAGVFGAAIATAMAQFTGSVIPLIIFSLKSFKGRIHIVKPKFDFKAIGQSAFNGLSELVSNIAMNVVCICFNFQLFKMMGQDGINAYGVIMYVIMIFVMVFIGFNMATCPAISYHYGAGNKDELKSLFKKSMLITAVMGLILTGLAEALSYPLSGIFVGSNPALFKLTKRAFEIFMLSYLVCGFNIFASAFFTALNNGVVSAIISSTRTFVLQIGCVFLIPLFMGNDGIWWSALISELLGLIISFGFIWKYGKRYGYTK